MLRRNFIGWFAALSAITLPRLTRAAALRLPWDMKNEYTWEAIVGHYRLWSLTPDAPQPYHAGYCGIVRYLRALPDDPQSWHYNTTNVDIWGELITGVSAEGLKARLEHEFFRACPGSTFCSSGLLNILLFPDYAGNGAAPCALP